MSYVDMILHYNIITMHMLPQDGDARGSVTTWCIVGLGFCEVGDTIRWHVRLVNCHTASSMLTNY